MKTIAYYVQYILLPILYIWDLLAGFGKAFGVANSNAKHYIKSHRRVYNK